MHYKESDAYSGKFRIPCGYSLNKIIDENTENFFIIYILNKIDNFQWKRILFYKRYKFLISLCITNFNVDMYVQYTDV